MELRRNMATISNRLEYVRSAITAAEMRFGRSPGSVSVLAVTKGQTVDCITEAVRCGQRCFGESYIQEAEKKINLLADQELEWHFIGTIQANKTPKIAQFFSWAHSVDRYKIAARLNEQRPPTLAPLNICLQINVSDEPNKSGIALKELSELAQQVKQLPNVRLRGLMAIPLLTPDIRLQRQNFATVRHAFEMLNLQDAYLDTLSMGMSGDMDSAIAEGATIVRIGTAIFGPRPT